MTMAFWWRWILATILAGIEILAPGVFFIWLAAAAAGTGLIALVVNAGPGMAWDADPHLRDPLGRRRDRLVPLRQNA